VKEKIIIVDFGSQYSQLIARRIREMEVYCEIVPMVDIEQIKNGEDKIKGIIFSGGPASVYEKDSPTADKAVFDLGIPILGICYGMQLITHLNGGKVEKAESREFGKAILEVIDSQNPLLSDIPKTSSIWMSHNDHITVLPDGFEIIARTDSSIAAITNNNGIYALQFHPEVVHSECGTEILSNFVFNICKCEKNWKIKNFIQEKTKAIKETVGDEHVLLALSGGVDSSVAAVLINNAIGKQLTCMFVDTGLLRKDEGKKVLEYYKEHFDLNIVFVDAKDRFLNKLKGVDEPEAKRKIIGNEFIEVFNEEIRKLKGQEGAKFLAQGTIYPDVIESQSIKGPSHTIKSHHNVGGLPEDLKFELLEPLKELFKDEVRKVGLELGIPERLVFRQPFPGPGLGIRIIGEVTAEKVKIVQDADAIYREEIANAGLVQAPKPMHFGFEFIPSAIISLGILHIVNSIQAIGDLTATTEGGMDRLPTDDELQGGIIGYGFSSLVGSVFGCMPLSTFSQNVGIVTLNKCINRRIFVFSSILVIIAGLLPKISAILTTIPQAVLGGATISVFATISMTGVKMVSGAGLNPRNIGVVGIALAIGEGIVRVPGSLTGFPQMVIDVFGTSATSTTTLIAVVLNLILPQVIENKSKKE